MTTDDQLGEVNRLRQQGHSPKQIARALGIKPAEATRLVRAAASRADVAEPALVGCWISPTWSTGLGLGDHPNWPVHEDATVGTDGMVSVLVARRHRYDKASVCGYLADELAREIVFGSIELARGLGSSRTPTSRPSRDISANGPARAPSRSARTASRCMSPGPTTIPDRSSASWNTAGEGNFEFVVPV